MADEKSLEFRGLKFPSLKSAAEHFGVRYKTVWHRLNSGISLDEAFQQGDLRVERLVTVQGKTFGSIRAAALHFGLNYKVVWQRIKSGKSMEVAFQEGHLDHVGQSKSIDVAGRSYRSITEAAKAHGVSAKTVSYRLSLGLSPEEAVGQVPIQPGNMKSIIVDGVEYESVRAASRAHNLDFGLVHLRLQRGKSIEDAFSRSPLPKKTGREKKINVDGKEFSCLKDATNHFGISYQVARYRMRRGWTTTQVFEIDAPPPNRSKTAAKVIEFDGSTYPSLAAFAAAFGQNSSVVRRKLKEGRSHAEAIGVVPIDYTNRPIPIMVNGKEFSCRNAAARHFGIDIGTVATRMNKQGWSAEEALELKPRPLCSTIEFGFVYVITNGRSNKRYVGITRQNLEKRFEQHLAKGTSPGRKVKGGLHEAIMKDGWESFSVSVLAEARSISELEDLERRIITELGTLAPYGYNLSRGGSMAAIPGRLVAVKSLGLVFESISEAARHFGVSPSAVLCRLNNGCSGEQAVGLEPIERVHPGARSVSIDNFKFNTIKEAAIHFGHPPNRVRNRIDKGWTIEDALKTPYSPRAKPVTIDGVRYGSIRAAATALGISNDTLRVRLKKEFTNPKNLW
jgi:molybdenum-dependent DNA-binding transcriptional regulator ModE